MLGIGSALARGYSEVAAIQRERHLSAANAARQTRMTAAGLIPEQSADPAGPAADTRAADEPDGVESVRLRLAGALAVNGADASPEAWDQAVLRHGEATRLRPPGELVAVLSADLAEGGGDPAVPFGILAAAAGPGGGAALGADVPDVRAPR